MAPSARLQLRLPLKSFHTSLSKKDTKSIYFQNCKMERTGFEKVFCFLFGIFVFCVIDGKRLEIFMLAALRFYELFALLGGSAFFFIVDVFCIVSF
jgi:hypothetical protein